ncbi:MAG: zinc-dependent metalloprotease [Actinomycetota bacterium]
MPDESAIGPSPMFDVELGTKAGAMLAGRQPPTTPAERQDFGESIRRLTRESDAAVRAFNGWEHAPPVPVPQIVARPAWIRANLEGINHLVSQLDLPTPKGGSLRRGFARRVLSVQVGGILGYVSQKVLGQYDFLDRLLFVGPNMIRLERRAQTNPESFRRWVAIHEVTHALQFTAVPWLKPHLMELVQSSIPKEATDPSQMAERIKTALEEKRSLQEMLLSPEQREIMERAQAMMSVIEGHATFVMNRVGEEFIPDIDTMREQVEAAKDQAAPPEKVVQKVIGLARKKAQYGAGEKFFDAITAAEGIDAMKRVFESPEMLPTPDEVKEPKLWTERVGS